MSINLGPIHIQNSPKATKIVGIGFRELKFFIIIFWIVKYCIRHLISPTVLSRLNPGIDRGGKNTTSKSLIYNYLTKDNNIAKKYFTRYIFIPAKKHSPETIKYIRSLRSKVIVLKPDKGARSAGVAIARNDLETVKILEAREGTDYVAQEFIDYPHELGVYYYKYPNWNKGKILGIAEKRFDIIIGDGRKPLYKLLRGIRISHAIKVHLKSKYGTLKHIPLQGEKIILATTIDHYDSGEYYDRSDLINPEIEELFNKIIGDKELYFCRFDIRAKNINDFYHGKNFKILELNVGPSAVILHAFDPRYPKMKQLKICYEGYTHAFNIAKVVKNNKKKEWLIPYLWFLTKDEIQLLFLKYKMRNNTRE